MKLFNIGLVAFGLLAAAGLLIAGCGGDEAPAAATEFAEAVPDLDMLSLSMGETGQAANALTPAGEESAPTQKSAFREHMELLMTGINSLLSATHEAVAAMMLSGEPVEKQEEGKVCQVWEATANDVDWKLTSCRLDEQTKFYHFSLKGRAAGSAGDYLKVVGGKGNVLPRFNNLKRGFGHLGYNFDNLTALTGAALGGKLGIGYRAAGRVRQVHLGLKEVTGPNLADPYTAKYKYTHLSGVGGLFRYKTVFDFLAAGETSVTLGQDGVDEFGKAAAAWNRSGAARTAWKACGGSLGEGVCVKYVHCWDAGSKVTYESIISGEVDWQSCDAVPFDGAELEPPEDAELELPDDLEPETDAPLLESPGQNAEE